MDTIMFRNQIIINTKDVRSVKKGFYEDKSGKEQYLIFISYVDGLRDEVIYNTEKQRNIEFNRVFEK